MKTQLKCERVTNMGNSPLGNLKDEKGPLSKLRKSYSFTLSELMPTAKIRPSGSNAATGLPARFMKP